MSPDVQPIEPHGARRVGVVAKRGSKPAAELAGELVEWLERRQIEVLLDPATAASIDVKGAEPLAPGARCDFVVVLGGDGTLLAVARKAAGGPPILGVNLGRLGFLTEVPRNALYPALVEVLSGHYKLEPRSLFEVEQRSADGQKKGFRALNDVRGWRPRAARRAGAGARPARCAGARRSRRARRRPTRTSPCACTRSRGRTAPRH